MNWDNYKNFLLKSIPGAKLASGGKVVNCKCRECPDSKDPRTMHFYISIPNDNNTPSMYYCHKCNCKGVVTHDKLIMWGIFDKDIAQELLDYNNHVKTIPKSASYFVNQIYKLNNTFISFDEKTEIKRKYICSRIGVDLSYQDLINLKICLNLGDILQSNNISHITRDPNIVKELDKEFIGFISIDNAFLNMRRTCEEGIVNPNIDKRYINYKIFDKFDTSQRFYTIPARINLNSCQPIKLHIAEGPFDILSIYLNLRKCENGIYTSVAGNNYSNVIFYFLNVLKIPNIEIHFYTDNDKYGSVSRMKYIKSLINDMYIKCFIHKNNMSGEKDFGVPLDRISESVMQI